MSRYNQREKNCKIKCGDKAYECDLSQRPSGSIRRCNWANSGVDPRTIAGFFPSFVPFSSFLPL